MPRITKCANALSLFLLAAAVRIPLRAQTIRANYYVSAVDGSDAAGCGSRMAPCRTITHTMTLTTTGQTIVLADSGDYDSFTVAKALVVKAAPGVDAEIHVFGGNGVTISAGSGDPVTLVGLSFDGSGALDNAIQINSAGYVHIENCRMISFAGSGIYAPGPSNVVYVEHTILRDSNYGIVSSATGDWSLTDVKSEGTANAIIMESTSAESRLSMNHCTFAYGRTGLEMDGPGRATVRDSVFSHFTNNGIHLNNGATALNLDGVGVTWNNNGIWVDSGTLYMGNTTLSDNGWGLVNAAGQVFSWGTNQAGAQLSGDVQGKVNPAARF